MSSLPDASLFLRLFATFATSFSVTGVRNIDLLQSLIQTRCFSGIRIYLIYYSSVILLAFYRSMH
jgi:hypothetical protein